MKESICAFFGMIGGAIAAMLGGWTSSLTTLLILMAIDYVTGLILAAVFKKSPKSDDGALDSKAGFKGLVKKGMMLVLVLVAHLLDVEMGTNYARDATCIALALNETISVMENAGQMGLPIPAVITDAIEVLRNKKE